MIIRDRHYRHSPRATQPPFTIHEPCSHLHLRGGWLSQTSHNSSQTRQPAQRPYALRWRKLHVTSESYHALVCSHRDEELTALSGWPGATATCWRGVHGGPGAAKMSHDAVMAPLTHTYSDWYQTGHTLAGGHLEMVDMGHWSLEYNISPHH